MELHEFISQTIDHIEKGLTETGYVLGNGIDRPQNTSEDGIVDFDILVSVTDSDTTSSGGKITVLSVFNGGLEKEVNVAISQSHHIKFQVKKATDPIRQTVNQSRRLPRPEDSNR